MTDRDFTLGVQQGSVTTPQLRPGGRKDADHQARLGAKKMVLTETQSGALYVFML